MNCIKRILISILIIILFFTPICFADYFYNQDGIIAYVKLNQARLSLPNGQVIAETGEIGDSSLSVITNNKPVDVVFLIDKSNSMIDPNPNRMAKVKQSVNNFIDRIFNEFEDVNAAIVSFSGPNMYSYPWTTQVVSQFSDNPEALQNSVNSIQTDGGGTFISFGIEKCMELFSNRDASREKFLIMFTDGVNFPHPDSFATPVYDFSPYVDDFFTYFYPTMHFPRQNYHEENHVNDYLEKLSNNYGVHLFSMLIDFDESNVLKEEHGNVVYKNVTLDQIENIFNEIFQSIYYDIVDTHMDELITAEFKNGFSTDAATYFILDNELKQSSILQLEYLVNIKSSKTFSDLLLVNQTSNLAYSSESNLLSDPSLTNSDFSWELYPNEVDTRFISEDGDSSNPAVSPTKEFQAKIIVSTLLSNKDELNFTNNFSFRLESDSGEVISKTLDSPGINVVPPFGGDSNTLNTILFVISTNLLVFTIILLFCRLIKRNTCR